MERPGSIPPEEEAPLSPGEARFEALLEERFASAPREQFARELDRHDRARRDAGFAGERVRGALQFQGDIPERARKLLAEWLPGLMAHAATQGMEIRVAELRIVFYTPSAYAAEFGGLRGGVKLPASSFSFQPLYRSYTVRVVLPEKLDATEPMLNVLRTLLTRLYGDVFLREEIFSLEAYREDVEGGAADVSVGLAEQVALLSQLPHTNQGLEAALAGHARVIGLNYKKQGDATRKDFFKEIRQDLEKQKLSPQRQSLVEETFSGYLATLRANPDEGVEQLAEAVEASNKQLSFLPPDEAPEYERLWKQQPLHYLRSVKLRLEFLLESFSGLIEDFETMDSPGHPLSPLAEERVAGCMAELEQQQLARPYLVPGVRLSEELERKRNAFPMEVHALMARFPAQEKPERLFKSISKKLESSVHQRLYNALLVLRHWIGMHGTGREDAFSGSEQYRSLKGAVANFKFRKPLLEALFVRIGVVLDVAESVGASAAEGKRKSRFPAAAFNRAWGQFAAHALLAGYLAERGAPKRSTPPDYWGRIENGLRSQIAAGNHSAQLVYLLRRLQKNSPEKNGLSALNDMLRQSSPSFRFAVRHALSPPPESKQGKAWLHQLDAWAAAVLEARENSLRNAIVIGEEAEQAEDF